MTHPSARQSIGEITAGLCVRGTRFNFGFKEKKLNARLCLCTCTCVRMGEYFSFQQLEEWVQMQEVPLGQEPSHQAVQGEEVEDQGL